MSEWMHEGMYWVGILTDKREESPFIKGNTIVRGQQENQQGWDGNPGRQMEGRCRPLAGVDKSLMELGSNQSHRPHPSTTSVLPSALEPEAESRDPVPQAAENRRAQLRSATTSPGPGTFRALPQTLRRAKKLWREPCHPHLVVKYAGWGWLSNLPKLW